MSKLGFTTDYYRLLQIIADYTDYADYVDYPVDFLQL